MGRYIWRLPSVIAMGDWPAGTDLIRLPSKTLGPSPTTTIPEFPGEEIMLFCSTELKLVSKRIPEKRESVIVLDTTSTFEVRKPTFEVSPPMINDAVGKEG